jgi:polysaccharide biosynthesis/export protein
MHRERILPILTLLALSLFPDRVSMAAAKQAQQQEQGTTQEPVAPQYTISPGDVLEISVWKEPELSGPSSVRLDGRATVQLLGDLQATGRTPNQLARDIEAQLARFLAAPQVTVTVSEAVSARFYVLGEVLKSGAIPLVRRTSVIQAIALAGGFREFAKKDHIVIIREKSTKGEAIPFNYKDVESGANLEQNVAVQPGDTILVP